MTRLLVCGSRDLGCAWEEVAIHLPETHDLTVIHGGCSRFDGRGVQVSADMIADFAARGLGHDVEVFAVDHRLDGPWPAAGPRRNARMLRDGRPTHGLAFGALWKPGLSPLVKDRRFCHKHSGTGGMVSLMLAAGLPVRWVPAPGEPAQDLVAMPAPTVTP